MSALLRRSGFALAVVVLLFAETSAARAEARLRMRIDEAVKSEAARGFSGAILVARGGTILVDKGYGSIGAAAIRPGSKFWISSIGKQFTAAAVLACRDNGWLTLDDAISHFFPNAPADKGAITIRQLLSHLSGFGQSNASEGHATRAEAVAAMFAEPLADAPGNRFHYSNNNYQLAAAIVEVASNAGYQQFASRALLHPADMHDTGFSSNGGWRLPLPARNEMPARLARPDWGAEGWYSTTNDLFRWYRALLSDRVLPAGSVAELFAPVAPIEEGQTALGWFVGKTGGGVTRIFTRGNDDWGPNSLIYAYPASNTVIIVLSHAGMANADLSWSRLVHRKIENLLFP
jgi:CubicO group peptidase (beta-lactamase class C family)